jgi:Na+-translocating ferredoxin:NAD+ oxidoreductase RnfA subunit
VTRQRWWKWRAQSYRQLAIAAPLSFVLLTALLLALQAERQRAIAYAAVFAAVQTLFEWLRIRRNRPVR